MKYAELAEQFNAAARQHTEAMTRYTASTGRDRADAFIEANAAATQLDTLLPKLLTSARIAGYYIGTDTDAAVLALITPAAAEPRRVWAAWRKLSNRWAALHQQGVTVAAPPESEVASMCPCGRGV